MASRGKTLLVGAAIGGAIALLRSWFVDPFSGGWYVPQTTVGWVAYYVGFVFPGILGGGVIGFFLGEKKTSPPIRQTDDPRF
jgi:hypothetical protein